MLFRSIKYIEKEFKVFFLDIINIEEIGICLAKNKIGIILTIDNNNDLYEPYIKKVNENYILNIDSTLPVRILFKDSNECGVAQVH